MSQFSEDRTRTIKSYVLRKGRTTKAQLRAINKHQRNYFLSIQKFPVTCSKFFENPGNKLIADVGFGSGESSLYLAESIGNTNIIGIEVYKAGIGKLLNKIKNKGLKNLKIINHDVEDLFRNFISDEIFDCLIFLYPDPWPKRKHHKRRLLNKKFLELAYKKLKPGGLICIKTDWEDYFIYLEKEFSFHKGWVEQNIKHFPNALKYLPATNYESKAIKEGRRLRQLLYMKRLS